MCASCHESCLTCKGLLDSDCLICDESYNRIVMGSHSLCIRELKNETTLLDAITSKLHWYSQANKFVMFLLAVLLVTIYFSVSSYKRKKSRPLDRDKNDSVKYSPIRNDNEDVLLTRKNQIINKDLYNDESDESEN
jgi:hypothetical protein